MTQDKAHATTNHPAPRLPRLRGLPVQEPTPQLSIGARRWLGRTLRMERWYTGHTEAEVAAAMGMYGRYGVQFVKDLEAGEVDLSRARAEALRVRLGIPAPELLEQVAHRVPTPQPKHRAPTRTRADARREALAILGLIVGSVLLVTALVLVVAGHPTAGAVTGGIGWAFASFSIVHAWD